MSYTASNDRYTTMRYNRCGESGLLLPAVSLGLWHNFGSVNVFSNAREMLLGAFDLGITHFDLANNYGPTPGSAEETLGKVLRDDLMPYRDELVIATKAGYTCWGGPYGDWGSKKYLTASLDRSLKHMGLDYVDIFYHHRPDPATPLEETMDALAGIVRQGKALYVGISNYNPQQTEKACEMLSDMGVKCLIHQMRYSMLDRANEAVLDVLDEKKVGSIAFTPLAQGLLTDRYLHGIPADSRAAGQSIFLSAENITEEKLAKISALNDLAQERGQSLAQMALAWVLQRTTTVLIGASRLSQIEDNVKVIENLAFSQDELESIDKILKQ